MGQLVCTTQGPWRGVGQWSIVAVRQPRAQGDQGVSQDFCVACGLYQTKSKVISATHKSLCFNSGENMVSLMTGLWQLIIPMILLSHFSASLPSRERPERHADGLFHSELSKMNGNAFVRQLVKHLMGLKERSQRHSDGLFTSEYSKMRGNAQVQKFIQNLMGRKRSPPGPVNTYVQEREDENNHEELCFMRLYQSFLNTSHSEDDAREAAAVTSQYICPIFKHLAADMKEDTESFD